jgi:hypothetical protein
MATAKRVAESILLHFDVNPVSIDRAIWREIPEALIERIRQRFIGAISNLSERWHQFSNEEAMTGFLFGSAAGEEISEDDWVARLEFIEFSKQKKEGEIGADVAIVIDVRTRDGRQAVKTIWLQAKHKEALPSEWRHLPQLEDQVARMRKHTESSYGVIYTRRGAIIVSPDFEDNEQLHLEELVAEMMRCRRGDESLEIFAQSVERLDTFRILLNQRTS